MTIIAAISALSCSHDGEKNLPQVGSDSAGDVDGATAAPQIARIEVSSVVEGACRNICVQSRTLKCSAVAQCMPNCLAMGSVTPCTTEILHFYDCLLAQPVANWECAPDGVAAIKQGFCDDEQDSAVNCMEAKMR